MPRINIDKRLSNSIRSSLASNHEKDAYGPQEFAERYSMSRSFLYKLWSQGLGPRRFKIGGKILITREATDEWVKKMEGMTEQRCGP